MKQLFEFKINKDTSGIYRLCLIFSFTFTIFFLLFTWRYLSSLGVLNIDRTIFKPIIAWHPRDNTIILDQNNIKIGELYNKFHIFTPFEDIPKDFINALLSIEDRDFFSHSGYDIWGIVRALYKNISSDKKMYSQGASTLTQQVIRHFLLSREKTIPRKIKEIFLAYHLEKEISKNKIIELYSNIFYLGSGSYGIGSAAKRLFDQPLQNLELHQLALIAGLFQSPSRYNPFKNPSLVKNRLQQVLYAMHEEGYLTFEEYQYWTQKDLKLSKSQSMYGNSSQYFNDYIQKRLKMILGINSVKNLGYKIYTTLDSQIQNLAEQAIFKNHDTFIKKYPTARTENSQSLEKKSNLEVAMLVNDPQTGYILAMIGGKNYNTSQFNRAYLSRRQPGSLFKPIVYSLALTSGARWNDTSLVSPINLPGNYRPKSIEFFYMKSSTYLRSFYESINSTTLEIGQQLGIHKIIEHANNLGVYSPMKVEYGTILGASEVGLFDMARVYSVFANYGRQVDLISILKIEDRFGEVLYKAPEIEDRSHRVVSEQVAFLITQGLRQVLQRGTGKKFHELSDFAVGKTGTTNNSRDNWFAGFKSNLTAVTWVGTDNSSPISGNAQGSTLALPIWAAFMKSVEAIRPNVEMKTPDGVTSFTINPANGTISHNGILMWFTKDNGPVENDNQKRVLNGHKFMRTPMLK